tara:strand:+ start:4571 stop:4774 length:204 start_codon:yes stop_codon:yes gene_type:complete
MSNLKYNNKDKNQVLLDKVDEGFNYFNGYRLEELKEDDVYYIESFMHYIEQLEYQVDILNEKIIKNK